MKPVNLIYACDENDVIGHGLNMPGWQNTDDFLLNFKPKTTGCPVIMGKNTALSLGRPLKDRSNIVISRNPDPYTELIDRGFIFVNSLYAALDLAERKDGDTIWIIGGGQIYALAMRHLRLNEIHVSRIEGSFPAPNKADEIRVPKIDFGTYKYDSRKEMIFEKRLPSGKDKGNADRCVVCVYSSNLT